MAQSGHAKPQVTLFAITSMSRYFQTWAIYKYAGLPDPWVDGVNAQQPFLQLVGCIYQVIVRLHLA